MMGKSRAPEDLITTAIRCSRLGIGFGVVRKWTSNPTRHPRAAIILHLQPRLMAKLVPHARLKEGTTSTEYVLLGLRDTPPGVHRQRAAGFKLLQVVSTAGSCTNNFHLKLAGIKLT